jgi:Fe-S-cluster-containing hydrogenase component 2
MIVIHPERCSGCERCQVNCSFFHAGSVGRSRSRVKVVKIEETGIDYPVICRQCRERYCTRCPESALEVGPLGQIVASPTLCTACGTCETLCPIGAIELYGDIPYVCDLCGGDPRCVAQCNMGAVEYLPDEIETVSLAPFKKESRGLGPEEKRVRFALDQTRALRETWKTSVGA